MRATLPMLLLLSSILVIMAGAQSGLSCLGGRPENARGSIEDGGFQVTVGSNTLNNNSSATVSIEHGHILQVNNGGSFRGVFIRFEGPQATSGALVLIPFVNVRDATSSCREQGQPSVVKAVTDSNANTDKTLALTTFLSHIPIDSLQVEITLAVSNGTGDSLEYYYSHYTLRIGDDDLSVEVPHPTAMPEPSGPTTLMPTSTPGPCTSAHFEAKVCRDFRLVASQSLACIACIETNLGRAWLEELSNNNPQQASCDFARSTLCEFAYDCGCAACIEEHIAWKTCQVEEALSECPITCFPPGVTVVPTGSPFFTPTGIPTHAPVPTSSIPTEDPNAIDCANAEPELQICFSNHLEFNEILACSTCVATALNTTTVVVLFGGSSDCTEISRAICASYQSCENVCQPCVGALVAQTSCELSSQSALPEGCYLNCDATFAPTVSPAPTPLVIETPAPSMMAFAPTSIDGPCAQDMTQALECLSNTPASDSCVACVDDNMTKAVLGTPIQLGCEGVVSSMCDVFWSCSCDPCVEPMFQAVECQFEHNAETFPAIDLTCADDCSMVTARPTVSPESERDATTSGSDGPTTTNLPTPSIGDRSPPEDATTASPTLEKVKAPTLQPTSSARVEEVASSMRPTTRETTVGPTAAAARPPNDATSAAAGSPRRRLINLQLSIVMVATVVASYRCLESA